jgi:hypothetical protein
MSVVIFNFPGILMLMAAMGAAFAFRVARPDVPMHVVMAFAAAGCCMMDLLWRARRGNKKWLRPDQGGNFLYLPVWILAMGGLALIAVKTYSGMPAMAQAANPWAQHDAGQQAQHGGKAVQHK